MNTFFKFYLFAITFYRSVSKYYLRYKKTGTNMQQHITYYIIGVSHRTMTISNKYSKSSFIKNKFCNIAYCRSVCDNTSNYLKKNTEITKISFKRIGFIRFNTYIWRVLEVFI